MTGETMVRAVAPTKAGYRPRWRWCSLIKFGNAYSVVLSNDPSGWAPGDRLNLSQYQLTPAGFGAACRLFNLSTEEV